MKSHLLPIVQSVLTILAAVLPLPAQERPRILGISHMAVKVSDIERSVPFYRDFLGFAEQCRLNSLKDGSLMLVCFKVSDEQSIEVFTGLQPGEQHLHQLAYCVDDAEAMRAHLAKNGWKVPQDVSKGQMKNLGFTVRDPSGYTIEFVQYTPEGWTRRDRGKFLSDTRVSEHITHGGVTVADLTAAMHFYGDILGFSESWRGGASSNTLSWINMKVPGSSDYVEFMLDPKVAPHFCLLAPDVEKAKARLESSPYRSKYDQPIEVRVRKNRKRQLNLYDPDGTRVELMEPNTVDGLPVPSSETQPVRASQVIENAAAPFVVAQEQRWRRQICDNFFVPEPLPALEASTQRRFTPAPGVRAEGVTYRTQFGLLVPAVLYLPDPLPAGKIPAFIVVNGHGGDKYSWYAWYTGILFARGGAAVLTYDPVGEGERNRFHRSGTRAHDSIKGDAALARHLAGLMITDVRQAVSYLSQRTEVDGRRIAAGGYSMGSFVLALAGAVEPQLHACVLVGGGNLDGPEGYWDTSKPMCQGLPYRSLSFLGDRPAVIYALHAARGPTLIFNGPDDTVVAIPKCGEPFFQELRQRVARLHGGAEGVFETGLAPAGAGHRPYFLTRPVVQWLEKQIDFPCWTEASIRSMPETRIGTWAEKMGVPLDKLYATEQREGGTPALGAEVPGYTPEMLNVLPRDQWESRKKDFILEAWLNTHVETSVAPVEGFKEQ